jgi:hypothetical protein
MKLKNPDTTKLKSLTESVSSLTKQVDQINELIFQLVVNSLFADYPDLKKFSFTGYTPAYNDGEECTFSLATYYPSINEDESDDYSNEVNKQLAEIVPVYLNVLPEEFYNSHFGTNFRVIATRESIDVEDYNCGY